MATSSITDSKSAALFGRALAVLPGGVNSPVRAMRAIGRDPLFIERADGAEISDVDGNRYVDYVCPWISGPHEQTQSTYRLPSTSTISGPLARSTKIGVRPIARIARTGEFTPPGSRPTARAYASADRVSRSETVLDPLTRRRARAPRRGSRR